MPTYVRTYVRTSLTRTYVRIHLRTYLRTDDVQILQLMRLVGEAAEAGGHWEIRIVNKVNVLSTA